MVSQELSSYIAQARALGLSEDAIRKNLLDAGWDRASVMAALPSGMPTAQDAAMHAAPPAGIRYAGYWRKWFAMMADGFIAFIPMITILTLYAIASFFVNATGAASPASPAGFGPGIATAIGLGVQDSRSTGMSILRAVLGFAGLLSLIWVFFYVPFYVGRRGATPGMRWLKIRALLAEEPGRVGIGFGLAFARMLLRAILGSLTGGLTGHWQLIDPRRQEVADKILKVVVIHEPAGVTMLTSLDGIPERRKRWVWFLLPAPFFIIAILSTLRGSPRPSPTIGNVNVPSASAPAPTATAPAPTPAPASAAPGTHDRDAQRIATIQLIRTGVELYYADVGTYPDAPTGGVLGTAGASRLCKDGWQGSATPCSSATYVGSISPAPTPADGVCSEQDNAYRYEVAADKQSYTLRFCTGSEVAGHLAGDHTATTEGIDKTP